MCLSAVLAGSKLCIWCVCVYVLLMIEPYVQNKVLLCNCAQHRFSKAAASWGIWMSPVDLASCRPLEGMYALVNLLMSTDWGLSRWLIKIKHWRICLTECTSPFFASVSLLEAAKLGCVCVLRSGDLPLPCFGRISIPGQGSLHKNIAHQRFQV